MISFLIKIIYVNEDVRKNIRRLKPAKSQDTPINPIITNVIISYILSGNIFFTKIVKNSIKTRIVQVEVKPCSQILDKSQQRKVKRLIILASIPRLF